MTAAAFPQSELDPEKRHDTRFKTNCEPFNSTRRGRRRWTIVFSLSVSLGAYLIDMFSSTTTHRAFVGHLLLQAAHGGTVPAVLSAVLAAAGQSAGDLGPLVAVLVSKPKGAKKNKKNKSEIAHKREEEERRLACRDGVDFFSSYYIDPPLEAHTCFV